jgi:chromosomal replication initiator protein
VARREAGLQRTWSRIAEVAQQHLGSDPLRESLRFVKLLALTPAEARLEVPSRSAMVAWNERGMPALRAAVASVVGQRQVLLDLPVTPQGVLFEDLGPEQGRPGTPIIGTLMEKYTFERFVVGASNQFAQAACQAVATQPAEHYNPLFIYGGVGLGKTHLVQAIAHHLLRTRSGFRVAYQSSELFMNALIASLRRDQMTEFKQRYRTLNLLILDDVQHLAGRERTQEEFFHTFNALHEAGTQIVLTSDTVPKDIPRLEERLRSRFEWGLIADIQPPDVETRVAIIHRKAEIEGIALEPDVALFLAEHVSSNVRELEGALNRLGAEASFGGAPITLETVRRVLNTVAAGRNRAVSFDDIRTAVCEYYSLRPADLASRRRSRHVATPRQLAMYLCRRHLRASFPQIGELFARDHSTVIHAVDVTIERLKNDEALRATVDQLERTLRTP